MSSTAHRPHDPASPHLVDPTVDATTSAVALLLHGGRELGTRPVRPWQTSVLRMRPFATEIRRRDPSVATAALRYRVRGWNGNEADPLEDVEWALDRLLASVGRLPVVLVGHSMGGRAALGSAGHPSVTGVVALAPWLPRDEPVSQLVGRDVVLLHGTRDHTTDPMRTADYADRAASVARAVVSLRMRGTGHTMLARADIWHGLTGRFVATIAAGEPIQSVGPDPASDGVYSTRVGVA
jgi:pimeloyl-ACP methyl ester carboxylesterase